MLFLESRGPVPMTDFITTKMCARQPVKLVCGSQAGEKKGKKKKVSSQLNGHHSKNCLEESYIYTKAVQSTEVRQT